MKKNIIKQYFYLVFFTSLVMLANADSVNAQVAESAGKVNGDVYGQIKVIGDVDGDGIKDLVFGATDGKVHLYSATGHEIFRPPYWPAQLDAPIISNVEIAGDAEGSTKIYATTMSGALFCLNSKGKTVWANRDACKNGNNDFSIDTVRSTTSPVLLPAENGCETIFFGTGSGKILVVDGVGGSTGKIIDVGAAVEGAPVIADVNKDGELDIISKNAYGKITINHLSNDESIEWDTTSKHNSGMWNFGVDAKDLNGDGIPEIYTTEPGKGSRLTIWNNEGKKISEFGLTEGSHAAPQIADIDGDGQDDFIITQADGKILVCDKTGKAKNGWPYSTSLTVVDSPQLVDMDGDGYPEIIFTGTNANAKEQGAGCVIALDRNGKMMEGFPKYVGKTYAKPTFADLDGDGNLEMIVAGGIAYTGNQIHIFRTDTKHTPKIAVIWQETIYK